MMHAICPTKSGDIVPSLFVEQMPTGSCNKG